MRRNSEKMGASIAWSVGQPLHAMNNAERFGGHSVFENPAGCVDG